MLWKQKKSWSGHRRGENGKGGREDWAGLPGQGGVQPRNFGFKKNTEKAILFSGLSGRGIKEKSQGAA